MTEKIKPCPFCGGEGRIKFHDDPQYGTGSGARWVRCIECGAQSREEDSEKDALEAWNRRANGWIKTSERVPEEGEPVLVHIPAMGGARREHESFEVERFPFVGWCPCFLSPRRNVLDAAARRAGGGGRMKYSSVCAKCSECTAYKELKCKRLLEYHFRDCPAGQKPAKKED